MERFAPLRFSHFDRVSGLRYGISTREDGNMRVADATDATERNRRRFAERAGFAYDRLVSAELTHGTHVHTATEEDAGTIIPSCDGLVTDVPGLILSVTGADCFPVYFVDPVERAVGIAHAGWRGITAGIVAATMQRFVEFGADPAQLLVGIGPGIRACHFEINEDVFSHFSGFGEAVIERDDKTFADLPLMIRRALEREGVPPSNVEEMGECTFELVSKYFSRRRDREGELQAMMAYLTLEQ